MWINHTAGLCFQLAFRTMDLAQVWYLQILTLRKACSVSIHLFLTFGSKLMHNRCWKGPQSHECEPALCGPVPLIVNEADSSAYLVVTNTMIEPTKLTYRLMPSSSSNFVGREDYLAKLEAVFVERTQTGSRPVSVLSALGGMGKTQIIARFAETRANL